MPIIANERVEVWQALRRCATASPSIMIRLNGSAHMAA